ncbi:hypothetical protein [Novosphingobium sp.]|uniref:hypothetical protein n=1 Tax=Novosphingobium sp. TaxID=1874826 RepID=UPI00286A265B|nr:hypothetical protein [Novosphingobium sp.]
MGIVEIVILTPNRNFALPGIDMMTIREGGDYFRDPFHRLNHFPRKPVDTYVYEPATHADWFWYMDQQAPLRLPYPPAREVDDVSTVSTWAACSRSGPADPVPHRPRAHHLAFRLHHS